MKICLALLGIRKIKLNRSEILFHTQLLKIKVFGKSELLMTYNNRKFYVLSVGAQIGIPLWKTIWHHLVKMVFKVF